MTLPVLTLEKRHLAAPLTPSVTESLSRGHDSQVERGGISSHPCPKSHQISYPVRRETSPVLRVVSDDRRHCFTARHQRKADMLGEEGCAPSCPQGTGRSHTLGEDAVKGWCLGQAAVASLGVTGTLVLTLARPLAAWPMPAEGALCGEEAEVEASVARPLSARTGWAPGVCRAGLKQKCPPGSLRLDVGDAPGGTSSQLTWGPSILPCSQMSPMKPGGQVQVPRTGSQAAPF